ncbi:MAG: precorrin-6y C5,15-methyltransferase (decarboxylating) subunit CbiE [Desulfatirhabdiaceae bacterium]
MNSLSDESTVSVIGMGMTFDDLTAHHLEIIHHADVLIAGKRHLAWFADQPAEKIEITRNISKVIDYIQANRSSRSIVVLASGDPLFHGIGSTLVRAVGPEHVRIYPNISSVCAAFAEIAEPWQDARIISLHGKTLDVQVLKAILASDLLAVLTDPRNTPNRIADFLLQHGVSDYRMCILERLGASDKSIDWYSLESASATNAGHPNIVILKRHENAPPIRPLFLGMPDSAYAHEAGMITKPEIRAVSVARLRLLPHHVMWDLGAGSGSVAIESSLLIHDGVIVAVEQKAERAAQIRLNVETFGVRNVLVREGVLPDALDGLPAPDRIFIGGGGKHLDAILTRASACLRPGGIIVINTVLLQSLNMALTALKNLGFVTTVTQIQTSGSRSMPWGDRMEAQNLVWIIAGESKIVGKEDNGHEHDRT